MAGDLSVAEALRRRWRATGLPTSAPGLAAPTAAEEVRRLGAVQAQEFELTLWALGRRTGESREQVVDAFTRGEFVRTHALRQTWHFVHRDDIGLVQAATAHRVHKLNAAQFRAQGLDAATLARAGRVVVDALRDGPLTRSQLGDRLASGGVPASGQRLGFVLMWAELDCLVVSGPLVGGRHTYAALPTLAAPPAEEAAARLAERFFGSRGPAAIDDFAAWSSLSRTQARQAAGGLPLHSARAGGRECLWLGSGTDRGWASPQVELLNGYDEYVSSLSPAGKRWLDQAGLARERQGTPIALVTVDGQLAGHWRRAVSRSRASVDVLVLREFNAAERGALDHAAARYAAFLGVRGDVRLRLTD